MKYIGQETPRVDGIAKVTGAAKYASEFDVKNVAHGYIVTSTIAKGRVTSIDTAAAAQSPGVIKVLTHENNIKPADDADNGFFALASDAITFSAQPIALVVAETFEQARQGARLVKATYEGQSPSTDVVATLDTAKFPGGWGGGEQEPRGTPDEAFGDAASMIEADYTIPIEHHNPMEPHAGIAWWDGGKLTIFNKSQSVHGDRDQVAKYFKVKPDDVSVVSLFVGGAFGSSLRPNYYTFLVAAASKAIGGRPVKLAYTRRQMFTGHGYRPFYWQKVKLAADATGKLVAASHDVVTNTPTTETYTEAFAKPARSMYACPNVATSYKIVETDLPTPAPMRAPSMVSAMTAFEIAMDELAYECGIDPLELRLINYAETDPESGKPFSSKALRECYSLASKDFGWERRTPEPRSMRDGRMLVGWGVATGTWGAMQQRASAVVTYRADGTARAASATSDIGPGTYTVMSMIAAQHLGLPIEKVVFELGDTRLPRAPSQGGSWTTASVGTAIFGAARAITGKLLELANEADDSPLADARADDVELADGKLRRIGVEDAATVDVAELMKSKGLDEITETYDSHPSPERSQYATAAHGAQFVEVKVDPDTLMVKVTRVIEATACGRIMNPLTSHSQEMGGVVWGIGAALHEATEVDHRIGRMMNASLAE